jgi:hypothetical protein
LIILVLYEARYRTVGTRNLLRTSETAVPVVLGYCRRAAE